jgi:predicted amidophosphoribosyltransferase
MGSGLGYCAVCGQCLAPGGQACSNLWCRRPGRPFSVAFALGVHRGGLRRAIHGYKYFADMRLGGVLASALASYLAERETWFEEFDVITGVPGYTGAGSRRGWDPIATMLDSLRQRLPGGSWSVEPGLVAKCRETPQMAGRDRGERLRIARGPLRRSLHIPDPDRVAGAAVLVVDDVLAEGSTLAEVAAALRVAGAGEVAGLVLARPGWDRPDPAATPPVPAPGAR